MFKSICRVIDEDVLCCVVLWSIDTCKRARRFGMSERPRDSSRCAAASRAAGEGRRGGGNENNTPTADARPPGAPSLLSLPPQAFRNSPFHALGPAADKTRQPRVGCVFSLRKRTAPATLFVIFSDRSRDPAEEVGAKVRNAFLTASGAAL